MTLVKLIGKIHLWLGLASGIVVFFVGLTGCIYVFQEEISRVANNSVWVEVEPQDKPFAPLSSYIDAVKTAHEGEIGRITFDIQHRKHDGVIVWVLDKERRYTAYVLDPYSCEILRSFPYTLSFWAVVIQLHVSLGIPVVGHHIVAASTLIFLILLITGIVLWWPVKRSEVKRSFWFRWKKKTRIKRINYDLHNVLGFYTLFALIFITVSGLTMSYGWLDKSIAWMLDGGKTEPKSEITAPVQSALNTGSESFEDTWNNLHNAYTPLERSFVTFIPGKDTLALNIYPQQGATYNRHDRFLVNPQTGKVISHDPWSEKRNSEIYKEAELNLHVGAILGMPGKILAFICCLVATSLPVTGFYIWWFRRKKRSAGKSTLFQSSMRLLRRLNQNRRRLFPRSLQSRQFQVEPDSKDPDNYDQT